VRAWELRQGDCVELMRELPENSIDAIVTDSPYGLGFMGKAWDALPPGEDWARECLRVLKPGGHIVAFGGQRTIHRLTVSLEDAGFEIRDLFGWLQWQGFPKSLDASKALEKAAGVEPIGERAPTLGMANNPQWNTLHRQLVMPPTQTEDARTWEGYGTALRPCLEPAIIARKPLIGTVAENLLEWGTGALNIDGCRYAYGDKAWPGPAGEDTGGAAGDGNGESIFGLGTAQRTGGHSLGRWPANVYATPKASRGERGEGNLHPTVKPVRLMRWLCVLVGCQPGSLILDPFTGSGSTGIAALRAGFRFLGREREPEYIEIARARIRGDSPLFNQERQVIE
jgi:hypothetical protein